LFQHLGNFVARHWLLVILAWAGLATGLHCLAPAWDSVTNDGDLAYLPEQMTSVRAERLIAEAFPDVTSKSQIVLIASRRDGPLTVDDEQLLGDIAGKLATTPGLPITGLWTYQSDIVGKKLISADRQAALAVLLLGSEFMAVQNIETLEAVTTALKQARSRADFPKGLELGVSGSGAIGGDMMTSARDSIANIELATVLLVLLILSIVYRAPVLVIIPLLTIVVSIVVSTDLVALLTQVKRVDGLEWVNFKVFKTTKIFIVTILFGSGTDFCLFLISRYREELERGLNRPQGLARALGQVGDAITASAMTTIFGLSMMIFASFGKFRNSGPAIGLCLFVALAACLTLAPALLRAFGKVVFWPFGLNTVAASGETAHRNGSPADRSSLVGNFWEWASGVIVARPGLILVTSVVLLSPLAYAGKSTQISYDLLADLEPTRPSVLGTAMVREHFPPGELGPVIILARRPGAQFDTKAGLQEIAELTKFLYGAADVDGVSGVEEVRSIAEPLGDPPGPASVKKIAIRKNPKVRGTFLSQVPEHVGEVTRLDVTLRNDPFSPQSAQALQQIDSKLSTLAKDRDSPWFGAEFDFSGVTAGTRDLKAVVEADEVLIQRLVVISVLGILIVVLRRPLICLYLILSVLFSYYVTIGATQLVFAWYFQPFHGLDWKVPIFLFVILIAVGEDYNIYLATRIFEEQKRHGLLGGLRRAVVKTGGIITSCGVIMAGTFVSMMSGSLRGMLELGFALTLGVVLDTLVVRPILVPAFLALLYRRADHPAVEAADEPILEISANSGNEIVKMPADGNYRTVGR
jgi:RND superfamily putative drug exporter